jgi:hypothetical protein
MVRLIRPLSAIEASVLIKVLKQARALYKVFGNPPPGWGGRCSEAQFFIIATDKMLLFLF